MEVEVYKAKDGWRWRKTAANGRIVAESGEGYTRYADCLEAAEEFADGEIVTPVTPARDEKDEANDAEQERLDREAEEELRQKEQP